ncbi:hypothetical protein PSHT_02115 [Puccinia striiformis]|uniref:Uncharacterized protein n=1 Tax=Puccinia striiformis TaxID=27350 RepID=A0A2S4WIT5_9BASI|nr:hypothetical protein PSHT_02115 [Puccinia striiformis]
MLILRAACPSSSDPLEHRDPLQSVQLQLGGHLSPLERFESGRSACQYSFTQTPMTPQPTPQPLLSSETRHIMFCSPGGSHADYPRQILPAGPTNRSTIRTESSSSSAVCFSSQLRFDSTLNLAHNLNPLLFLYAQPVAIPRPSQDQVLLRSILANLAKSCVWSSIICPLIYLILTYQHQLRYRHSIGRASTKLFDQLELFFQQSLTQVVRPSAPAPKSLLRFSAPPPPKRIRTARGFRCSALVDRADSSILHHHQPSPFHLDRSVACRTAPRPTLFIRPSCRELSRLEIHRLSARAQSQMQRSPYCSSEDSLDSDQRHQRYYLVNAYRTRLSTVCTSINTQPKSPLCQQSDVVDVCVDDDDDELEPLEDLLDWDCSTRYN